MSSVNCLVLTTPYLGHVSFSAISPWLRRLLSSCTPPSLILTIVIKDLPIPYPDHALGTLAINPRFPTDISCLQLLWYFF